jgi:UDP-N-acetylmuramoyl-tripeptide--D-alanyl-D-alanine ligase
MNLALTLKQAAELLALDDINTDANITGAVIDSRKVKAGDLFVALAGDFVDGHDYIKQAREAGAVAALVSRKVADPLPQLLVDDVTAAFGKLAQAWRQQSQAKFVAITGSNGKTTLKEMTTAILKQAGKVIATRGNLNNELGVPLTLFEVSADDDFAVIEMGANHHGEIERLVAIAQPDVAVINNVGPAHLEGFGSLEGVAQAKGEIYAGLKLSGVAVINADMPYQSLWQQLVAGRQSISFGLENKADISAKDINISATGSHFMVELDEVAHFISLPVPGKHNIANALAAIAVCRALTVPVESIVKGLSSFQGVARRLQLRAGVAGAKLIDDSYNANPASFQQALETLMSFSGHKWLVLGDFAELGDNSAQVHADLGEKAAEMGIERLFTVGNHSQLAAAAFGEAAEHFSSIETLQAELEQSLSAEVVCLIKGSRFMQLDKLADGLAEEGER